MCHSNYVFQSPDFILFLLQDEYNLLIHTKFTHNNHYYNVGSFNLKSEKYLVSFINVTQEGGWVHPRLALRFYVHT